MDRSDFEAELDRRLVALDATAATDPARQDLPRRDLVLTAVGAIGVCALMWWWGYPA